MGVEVAEGSEVDVGEVDVEGSPSEGNGSSGTNARVVFNAISS
jgi:hypothetical protein